MKIDVLCLHFITYDNKTLLLLNRNLSEVKLCKSEVFKTITPNIWVGGLTLIQREDVCRKSKDQEPRTNRDKAFGVSGAG